jgi:hypothetical protein
MNLVFIFLKCLVFTSEAWPGKQNENIQAHIRQINVNPIEEILVKLMVNSAYFRTQYRSQTHYYWMKKKVWTHR